MRQRAAIAFLAVSLLGCPLDIRILVVADGNDGGRDASDADAVMLCTGTPAPRALITDFSSATGGGVQTVSFDAAEIAQGVYAIASAGLSAPLFSLVSVQDDASAGQVLEVVVDSGIPPADAPFAFVSVGLSFAGCVDASAYSAIQFKIDGDLGDCALSFGAGFPQDVPPPFGTCQTALCGSPLSRPIRTGTMTIPFEQLSNGVPVPTPDTTRITSIFWQFTVPVAINRGCSANFTIADVSFVR